VKFFLIIGKMGDKGVQLDYHGELDKLKPERSFIQLTAIPDLSFPIQPKLDFCLNI